MGLRAGVICRRHIKNVLSTKNAWMKRWENGPVKNHYKYRLQLHLLVGQGRGEMGRVGAWYRIVRLSSSCSGRGKISMG